MKILDKLRDNIDNILVSDEEYLRRQKTLEKLIKKRELLEKKIAQRKAIAEERRKVAKLEAELSLTHKLLRHVKDYTSDPKVRKYAGKTLSALRKELLG